MSEALDIDDTLRDWPYQPGVISARLVRAADGREVLQMRVEMGLLQMEIRNRPDGTRPGDRPTYLNHLLHEASEQGRDFELDEEQRCEVDREFLQFYHRRICWLALREFQRAVQDAEHTLALMDFVADHSSDEDWVLSHQQYRPLVLFHRTEAASLAVLEDSGAEAAIEEIDQGINRIHEFFRGADDDDEQFDERGTVQQLLQLREWIRQHYQIGRTLAEQLADAVAAEQYELAAKLRDRIARRQPKS